MSLRSLRRSSISSISRVRPSASKRFDGLKYCRSVWSRSVMATELEHQAVLLQRLRRSPLHAVDVLAPLLVHFDQRHLRRNRAQRGNELAGQEGMQSVLLHGAPTESGGGRRDRLPGRRHPHVEFSPHVDAHAILGDQRILFLANYLHLENVHVHGSYVVNDRKHEGSAIDDDLFSEEAGPDEGHLLRRPAIEPIDEVDDDRNDDDGDDEPEYQGSDELTRHRPFLPTRNASLRRRSLLSCDRSA